MNPTVGSSLLKFGKFSLRWWWWLGKFKEEGFMAWLEDAAGAKGLLS